MSELNATACLEEVVAYIRGDTNLTEATSALYRLGMDKKSAGKVLRMLATGLEWKRVKKEWWEIRWFGPWLTTEEMNQLPESNFEDYNIVPPEEDGIPFRGSKYLVDQSSSSSLDWINTTYK